LLVPVSGICQNNIPTGSWRTHYSFNTTISVTQSPQEVFAASKAGLYIINKADQSIKSITKLNGLSETGISVIHYNNTTNTLIIAYDNGQLDLIKENKISAIPDIKLSDILDTKVSYQMNEDGIYTYLSTDFGLLKINTETQIIQESFLNLSNTGDNLKIYASTIYNDSLFLATETGLIAGSLSDNLKDFAQWKRFDGTSGINQEKASVLGFYEDKPLTANLSQGLLQYNNGIWLPVGGLIGATFTSIYTGDKTLITASDTAYILESNVLTPLVSENIIKAEDGLLDGDNSWIADNKNGLVYIIDGKSESLYPNGPFFNSVSKLKTVQNKVFALPPHQTNNGLPLRNNAGFSVFENGFWSNYNSTGYPKTEFIPEFLDITSVSSKKNGELIFSSYGYGLLLWSEGNFEIMDELNSPLINYLPPARNVAIKDIDSQNGNLWVLNNNTTTSLHQLTNENDWTSYSPSNGVSNATQIVSTPWGDQWIGISSSVGGGIIVHNITKEEAVLKSSGTGTIPSNTINQLLLDKEGKMWIATTQGVVYYLSPFLIIENPLQEAIMPIINSQLLFNGENVNCLAVDGGNRMWMGTNKGAWLFDNDGSVLIEHFTEGNSPLLSDIVIDISINNLSGEVFFNTDKGLISYRGTASITGTYKTPKIFPNPVTPGFSGVITIEGVPTNAELKITDASGRLVANIEAHGNTAIWDMYNAYSSEVGTGVYFVFVSNADGSVTQFGKIAIVK